MNALTAFFYLHDAEQPPENAPDEWFLAAPALPGSLSRVDVFARHARALADDLGSLEGEAEFQSAFYERAKAAFGTDGASIREFFRMLYLLIFRQQSGPRWGQFVAITGRDDFIALLRSRLESPLG